VSGMERTHGTAYTALMYTKLTYLRQSPEAVPVFYLGTSESRAWRESGDLLLQGNAKKEDRSSSRIGETVKSMFGGVPDAGIPDRPSLLMNVTAGRGGEERGECQGCQGSYRRMRLETSIARDGNRPNDASSFQGNSARVNLRLILTRLGAR